MLDLLSAAGGARPRTLADAGLAPAALLNLKWQHAHGGAGDVLRPELMATVQPLE